MNKPKKIIIKYGAHTQIESSISLGKCYVQIIISNARQSAKALLTPKETRRVAKKLNKLADWLDE